MSSANTQNGDDLMDLDSVHIQLLSDLHLEMSRHSSDRYEYDFPVKADILALLGDIGLSADDDRLYNWLRLQLTRFRLVFFLSGNHEYYRSSLKESSRKLATFVKECQKLYDNPPSGQKIGRFVLLDRTRYDVSRTVTVLGCTLWSRLNPADIDIIKFGLNDFRLINDMTPDVYQSLHKRDVEWLGNSIARISRDEPHKTIVVMTHHAPTCGETSHPRFSGTPNPLNSAFSTELTNQPWWNERVKVWMFGHTHWPCDFVRKGVRVVSNPKGYGMSGEDGYAPDFVVEIV